MLPLNEPQTNYPGIVIDPGAIRYHMQTGPTKGDGGVADVDHDEKPPEKPPKPPVRRKPYRKPKPKPKPKPKSKSKPKPKPKPKRKK